MPNHIVTEVEIKGNKEAIKSLIERVGIVTDVDYEVDNKFDFNGVVKMPEELRITVSPTKVLDTQEEIDAENERHEKSWSDGNVAAISKDEAAFRMEKYGALNWYDWANKNWGTKWNSYEVHLIDYSDEKLVVKMETAWDTPRVIWEKLESEGFIVNCVLYGEMEGYETIGENAEDVFSIYQKVEVEYMG